MEQNSKTH